MSEAPLPCPPDSLSPSLPINAINAILKTYHDHIKHVPSDEWGRAVRAIRLLGKKGLSEDALQRAVHRYAASFATHEARIKFAKAANRFFTYQVVEAWLAPSEAERRAIGPSYAADYGEWCHHDPPCPHREWHAVLMRREGR